MAAPADVKLAYLADHAAFLREDVGPKFVRVIREAAIASFAARGFPTLKDEDWKYTNVSSLARQTFRRSGRVTGVSRESLAPFALPEAIELVFVNGHLEPSLGSRHPVLEGIEVGSLMAAADEEPEEVQKQLGKHASFAQHPFVALNTAFWHDGAYLHVPANEVLERPLHLLFLSAPGGEPTVSHPRNLLVLEPQSQATVIETYAGIGEDPSFTNAVTEVVVGEGAHLERYKVQRETERAHHLGTTQYVQGRDAQITDHSVSFGGALVRSDVNAAFAAQGGSLTLNGLFSAGGGQFVDNHTKIDHAHPHGTSAELYKGILDGRARGVFHGNVLVRAGAAKTNARQTNRNILLSTEARMDSIPGLEIHHNDVKCTHGSSIGRVDEQAVFYLRSRGIDEVTAKSLLVFAFTSDLLAAMKVTAVRDRVARLLMERLPNAEGIREVQ